MWDKIVKGVFAVAGAIAGIFGEWNALLTILAVCMVLDYISGLIVAAMGRSPKTPGGGIDSKVGFAGLAKKAFIILIVLLATVLDNALGVGRMVFQTAATCYYIGNEGLSIVENAGIIGVPVPAGLKKAMEQRRDKNDNTGGDDDDKPPEDPAE